MYKLMIASVLGCVTMASGSAANPLAPLLWDKRPIVLFAQSADNQQLRTQLDGLNANRMALFEREQIVITVVANKSDVAIGRYGASALPSANSLRDYYGVTPAGFTFLLIGKDGGVKRRSEGLVAPASVFCQIDAMPMRRDEMRRAGQKSAC